MAKRGVIGVTAVVLAGGPHDELAARTPGAPNKAFIAIGGVALVERTLRALRASASVGRIVVVAPHAMFGHPSLAIADEFRADGERIRDSLRSGLAGLNPDQPIVVSTSDLPVLTAEAVDDYVMRAFETEADVTYGCVERSTHMARYPQVPHTWARLHGGTYCGTGLVTLRPRVFGSLERFVERLGRARKNPLSLARLFGPRVLVKFALRRLTIADAEARASKVLGATVRAVISPYPEIAVNVDRLGDIQLAEAIVKSAAASPTS